MLERTVEPMVNAREWANVDKKKQRTEHYNKQ